MENKLWYAVQRDPDDDWSTGSYDRAEAIRMAKKQIADYLDTRLQAIDNLKQVVLQQIDILQERKQIIINDVVTGKVKVV